MKDEITVFEAKIHGEAIIDTLKSNVVAMIEAEIENLENDEFDVLKIEVRRKKMTIEEYKNLPEFDGF